MKLKNTILLKSALLALLGLTAVNVHASFISLVTFSATAQLQGSTTNNGKITITTAPTSYSLNNKQLLSLLAKDEYAEGNYASNSFPAGALLAVVTTDGTNSFQVLTKTKEPIITVDDLLSVEHGTNDIVSGRISDTNSLSDPTVTHLRLATLRFDDSGITNGVPVGVTFKLIGLQTKTVTDTVPTKAGVYTETVNANIPAFVGEGTVKGTNFVVTAGSLNIQGSNTY